LENIFITGVSGYIGQKLVAFLDGKADVQTIVGIDIRAPSIQTGKLVFYKKDVREPVGDILLEHGIDTVVHLAYVVPPLHDKSLMENVNIGGTRNILASLLKSPVEQIIYTSSATAYGFHADNDNPLTEDSPLRGNDDFVYSKNKKEIERLFSRFSKDNPGYTVSILRPSFVAGPVFDNPLARHMKKKFVLLPSATSTRHVRHSWILPGPLKKARLLVKRRFYAKYPFIRIPIPLGRIGSFYAQYRHVPDHVDDLRSHCQGRGRHL